MKDIVYVKGNIIAESGLHLAKDWIALASEEFQEIAIEVIEGDYHLDEHNQFISYFRYAASGNVACLGFSQICAIDSPTIVKDIFDKDISHLEELLELQVPSHLQQDYLRHMFIGAISTLELFLTEMLCCLILGDERNYNAFISLLDDDTLRKQLGIKDVDSKELPKKIYKAIHHPNSNMMNSFKQLYEKAFGIEFPHYENLQRKISRRHNFAHRSGYRHNEHQMLLDTINKCEVKDLMEECGRFVSELMRLLHNLILKWNHYE